MPLKKTSGNMYEWISHMHSLLGGACPHECSYCYIESPRWGRPKRYTGPIHLIQKELKVQYGTGKTIFIEHMNDLFSREVSDDIILKVINHCKEFHNTYVWQTKNPHRYGSPSFWFPEENIFGTTIETNRDIPSRISKAPRPVERMVAMEKLQGRKFVTIEPVLDFDVDILASWIDRIRPEFLNLGADSKNHNLPEPSVEKIFQFVDKLHEYGIELREKHNLKRLTERNKGT